jgi:hypothetical protein
MSPPCQQGGPPLLGQLIWMTMQELNHDGTTITTKEEVWEH